MQLEEQMKVQEVELAALKEELSRLNAGLEGAFKDAGLGLDQLDVTEADIPAEVRLEWEALKKAALRAGEARKARAAQSAPASGGASSGGRRRGVVRI